MLVNGAGFEHDSRATSVPETVGPDLATPSPSVLRLRLFRQLRSMRFRPWLIVDSGVYQGDWSRGASAVSPEARYTLIEPQAEMRPHLDAFCAGVADARWLPVGVAGEIGERVFTVTSPGDGRGFIYPDSYAREHGLEQRPVQIRNLDEICADGPMPEIVKLDAEGLELEAMAGARSLIGQTELFFLEAALFDFGGRPLFHDVLDTMRRLGYEFYDITDLNRRPIEMALGLVELAFARRAGLLRDHARW